jgi:predicted transcriptional regulator
MSKITTEHLARSAYVYIRQSTADQLTHNPYEDKKYENANRTRAELIAEILREYERHGDAMRYLNAKGQIAWKATPLMLQRLADAEREVRTIWRTRGEGFGDCG